ncbi:MAG: hypothetical protein ACI8RZ_000348 [Myxococcota bacterium]|jgi:hypothetical protein
MLVFAILTACNESLPVDSATDEPQETETQAKTWYLDSDTDGYGDPATTAEAATAPDGHVVDGTDCDDSNAAIHPGVTEVCDHLDNNCDGVIDEDLPLFDWYPDSDGDGWGDDDGVVSDCVALSGHIETGGDCDDIDSLTSPDAAEVCDDGIDNNCDGWDSRCRLEGTISLADAEARYLGMGAGDVAGNALACGGDTNGDGIPELLIGESEQFRDDFLGELAVGGAWLVTEWSPGSHDLDGDSAIPLWGNVESWYRGETLRFLNDPLNDGYDGVMLGSSKDAATYIYYGPITTSILPPDADAVILPEYSGVNAAGIDLGEGAVVVAGTGNQTDDSGSGENVGKAFLFKEPVSGSVNAGDAHATFTPHTDNDWGYFGWSVCGEDLDGDGVKDLVIGMPSIYPTSYPDFMAGGAVYIIYGPFEGDYRVASNDGTLLDADARIEGSGDTGGFGYSISCNGDTDADGLPDLLIGAPYEDPGYAFLFRTILEGVVDVESADATVVGTREGGYSFGKFVSLDADLDANGQHDIVLGSGYMDSVYLFYGGLSGTHSPKSADSFFEAETEADYPSTVAGCPDMDGDGFDDLLIGAENESTNGQYSGAAYLILGGGG